MDNLQELATETPDSGEQSLLNKKRTSSTIKFPEEFARFVIEKGDVFWWPAGKFYVVSNYEYSKEILKSPNYTADRSPFFISRMPNLNPELITDFFGVIMKMMVMSDHPEHSTRRKFAAVGINNDLLNRYQTVIDQMVTDTIEETSKKGYIEFATEIAEPLPARVLAKLFCIPEEDRKNFYKWSKVMTQFFGGASQYRDEDGIEVNHSAVQIRDYFQNLINLRKKDPQDDFFTPLLQNQKNSGLDDSEIVAQAVMMLVAGQVTTTDQLNNNMYSMLCRPSVFETLRQDLNLIPSALEEFNRLDPGVTFIFRLAKTETTIGHQTFQPGDVIFVANHAINRDPKAFENPNECMVTRPLNPQHFAYGYGPHFCLGARLARIQMISCFRQLIEKFPTLHLDPNQPAQRKHYSLAFSGFDTLHLKW